MPSCYGGVGAAATAVTQALNELLQHVRAHATGAGPAGRYDQATDTILTVTENIFSSMGDAGEMVRQARILAQATSDLVNAIKADAEGESDLENSRKLLSAAKILADATAKMVEAAKEQPPILTVRSNSSGCGRQQRVSAWQPMPLHRTPSRKSWCSALSMQPNRLQPRLHRLSQQPNMQPPLPRPLLAPAPAGAELQGCGRADSTAGAGRPREPSAA